MDRQDRTLFIAFCASICLHFLLLQIGLEAFVRAGAGREWAVLWNPKVLSGTSEQIGESTGLGDSTMASPGDEAQLARQASQNQSFLSRDPVGFGEVGDRPSMSVALQGKEMTEPAVEAPVEKPLFGVQTDSPPPSPHKKSEQGQKTEIATNSAPSADPAPMSESESDPFSVKGSAVFRPGKSDVQFGRKCKLTRPQIPLAGKFDLMSLPDPRVILKLKTDETGKVVDVEIIRSSGSNDIDLPCRQAAYEWWFEPPKDKSGHPRGDVMLFSVGYVG